MFHSLLVDDELEEFLSNKILSIENKNKKWMNTLFEKYYILDAHSKGEFGENFIKKWLTLKGHQITKRKNTGHDCLVDGIKTEIKFSLDGVINHVATHKDWERIIFCFIKMPEEYSLFLYMEKSDFIQHINGDDSVFGRQQGGKNGKNDDYMCGEKDLIILKSTKQAKCMSEWIPKIPNNSFVVTKRKTIEDYAV
jgi:hypothetical protein